MDAPDDLRVLVVDGTGYRTRLTRKFAARRAHEPVDPMRVIAHIPGVIASVPVAVGQRLSRGQPVVVLEAMKMRNAVIATEGGVVKAVHVRPGQMVARGELLAELG